MSRIYFHFQDGEDVKVRGAERHAAGSLCGDMMLVAMGITDLRDTFDRYEKFKKVIPRKESGQDSFDTKGAYLHSYDGAAFFNSFQTWVRVAHDNFLVGDHKIPVFTVSLNSAFVLGSDPVRLMARLHGQCEIHCYTEENNRGWLASIIQQGLDTSIMRPGMQWEELIEKLKDSDTPGPVVCSYSICEQFPNSGLVRDNGSWKPGLDEEGEENWDEWYNLDFEKQWDLCITALRSGDRGLELKPDNWRDYFFGSGVNGFDIAEYCLRDTPITKLEEDEE